MFCVPQALIVTGAGGGAEVTTMAAKRGKIVVDVVYCLHDGRCCTPLSPRMALSAAGRATQPFLKQPSMGESGSKQVSDKRA